MPNKVLSHSQRDFNNLRRQRLIQKIHQLGPRAMAEFINELAFDLLAEDAVDAKLERYAALDPAVVAAFGGDRFPASPIRKVVG